MKERLKKRETINKRVIRIERENERLFKEKSLPAESIKIYYK